MSSTLGGMGGLRRESAPLPVWPTVVEILFTAWRGKARWLRLVPIPLAIQVVILFIFHAHTVAVCLSGLLYVPAVTAWIRYLDKPPRQAVPLRYHWGGSEAWYIARALELSLAALIVTLGSIVAAIVTWKLIDVAWGGAALASGSRFPVGAMYVGLVGIGVVALLLWVNADFLMTLPAAANGDDSSFRASAALTRGHRWQIVAIGLCTRIASFLLALLLAALFVAGVYVLIWLLRLSPEPGIAKRDGSVVSVLITSFTYAIVVPLPLLINATALGCVYRHLRPRAPRPVRPPAERRIGAD
jgi:hypothetical protein